MKLFGTNIKWLFNGIYERGNTQGVFTREGYYELVKQYVQNRIDLGELSGEVNSEFIISELKNKWPDYEKLIKAKKI